MKPKLYTCYIEFYICPWVCLGGDVNEPISERRPWILIEDDLSKDNVEDKSVTRFIFSCESCDFIYYCRPTKRRKIEDTYNQATLYFQTGR